MIHWDDIYQGIKDKYKKQKRFRSEKQAHEYVYHAAGTIREAAAIIGVSLPVLSDRYKYLGIEIKKIRRLPTWSLRAKMQAMDDISTKTARQLARRFDTSERAVHNILSKYKIPYRKMNNRGCRGEGLIK